MPHFNPYTLYPGTRSHFFVMQQSVVVTKILPLKFTCTRRGFVDLRNSPLHEHCMVRMQISLYSFALLTVHWVTPLTISVCWFNQPYDAIVILIDNDRRVKWRITTSFNHIIQKPLFIRIYLQLCWSVPMFRYSHCIMMFIYVNFVRRIYYVIQLQIACIS